MVSAARSRSSAVARGVTRMRLRWRWPWMAIACPAAAISAASAGERSTSVPTRKNVALAPRSRRISSTAGVPSGCGPSSKVSATAPGSAFSPSVRGFPSARASGGACGARPGRVQAAAAAVAPAAAVTRAARTTGMLSPMLEGLLAAAAASACYEGGYALQALEARAAPHDEALRASLLRRLIARPRWLIGTALTFAGAALQTLALGLAPVAVVQAVLALGLAGLLVLAHFVLRERIGLREVAAVAAVGAGVALVASGAPDRETTIASTGMLVACLAVLGAVAVAPFALRGGPARPRLAVAGAAAADGLGAVALKLLADALDQGRLVAAAGAVALACAGGGLALTAEMS